MAESESGKASERAAVDRRLLRGARSRRAVTRRAVDIASADGLDGLSFGRLAQDLGLSKAGIQTLFRTKEDLQLATVETAREIFVDVVVRPGLRAAEGAARVRALVEEWIDYAAGPLFPGGCFWGATLPEFDSRPGPVRDALRRQQRAWLETLVAEFQHEVDAGEIAATEPEFAAFQMNAVLTAANVALRLGDGDGVAMARRVMEDLLAAS